MDIYFTLQSESDGSPLTGASSITVYLSKDGGTLVSSTNSATEIGRGMYKLTLSSSESEFSTLLYQPVCTGAQTNTWAVDAEPTIPSASDNATAIWGSATRTLTASPTDISGLATSTDLSSVASNVSAIKAKTDNLPASPAASSDIPTAAIISSAVWSETTRTVTGIPSTVADLLDQIHALLGDWTMGETTLTTTEGNYTLTRDTDGNITAITPASQS